MSRPVIATPDWSDAATLTAQHALATAPVTNLQKIQPKDIWDSDGNLTTYLEVDRGSQQPFNVVSLLYTNLTESGTWQVRSANSQAGLTSSPDYDSGIIGVWPSPMLETWDYVHTWLLLPASQTNQWVRIDLSNAGNPAGTIQAGRLYVSNAWQSSLHMQLGLEWGFVDESPQEISTVSSTRHIRPKERIPTAAFNLGLLPEAETMTNLFDLFRVRGSSEDVLAVLDTTDTTYLHHRMIYGTLLRSRTRRNVPVAKYSQRIEIQGLV